MTTQELCRNTFDVERAVRLLARLRQRQLQLAQDGKHIESERYHRRVNRVRQAFGATMAAV